MIILLIQDFILKIKSGTSDPKFTDLMEKAIRWDVRIMTMAKVDTNQSILGVWKHKYMAVKVLNTMINLINLFKMQHIEMRNSQSLEEEKLWASTDKYLNIFMMIAIHDIDQVKEHLADIINNPTIGPAEFWEYLNETWQRSFYYKGSWLSELSANSSLNKLYVRKKIPIHKWLSQNVEDFNYDDYYKQIQKTRDSNEFQSKMNQVSNLMVKNNYPRSNRKNYNNNGSNANNNTTIIPTTITRNLHKRKGNKVMR